jgi:two-component system response regulator HydG
MRRDANDDVATERREPHVTAGVSYVVTVVEGPDAGRSITLDPSRPARALVGKSPACDLVLTDVLASRRHAAFETAGLRVSITDLGSTNGTLVNDVAVASAYVTGGEIVRLGASALRVDARATTATESPMASAFGRLVGNSARMRVVYTIAQRLARAAIPLVIEGETGTGKELLAECIHEAGPRADGPFVVFDGSATPRESAAQVLFGDKRDGSVGLFELAHGGTLFVDEVGELDVETQGLLLRAIERGEIRRGGDEQVRRVDVRAIAATSRDVDKLVEEGKLREELFFRLAVGRIELPPLRRRGEDALVLARHFWRRVTGREDLPPSFIERYVGYDWPGNVRELSNTLARLAALGESAALQPSTRSRSRPPPFADEPEGDPFAEVLAADLPFSQARQRIIDVFERAYVARVLAQNGGNVARSAAVSGIARRYFQVLRARQTR